jgi:hypothetical protein
VNSSANEQAAYNGQLTGYQTQAQGQMAGYQAQMQQYLQSLQAQQATQGGLFGLGGSVLGGLAYGAGAGLFGIGGTGPDGLPMSGMGSMTGNAALSAARAYGPAIVG